MPKLPIFRFLSPRPARCPDLGFFTPVLAMSGLQLGVDNLRYDVHLGERVIGELRSNLSRYICRFGEVEALLELDVPGNARAGFLPNNSRSAKAPPADFKGVLVSLHLAFLNRAKTKENPSVDVLGRLAALKFLRFELQHQFGRILEQCRLKSKSMEGFRQLKMFEVQGMVANFQARKKIILRKTGQEVLRLLREIEKETLARTRRSLFGDIDSDSYRLFLNPLIFTDDGRDDYLCAEQYYMFGNFDKDPDRFANLRRLALEFLRSLGYPETVGEHHLEQALGLPDNAAALIGTGHGDDDGSPEGRDRSDRLELWARMLQKEGVLNWVMAGYETAGLLNEYAPLINPQQLKNALISREEGERVEKMVAECRLSSDRLYAATGRVASCRGPERGRIAARLLRDLFCYQRDLRSLEAVNTGFDSVNLIGNDKVRELSIVNGMLYEFLPPEDQKAAEERVLHHVILKADVRDSTRLTRSLVEKGMNPASYFSLNLYEPVNQLLAKYNAEKVFLEGDAIIVAFLEREGEPQLGVSHACVLAWEILSLLRGYNELLERSGLPQMEIGLGIAYHDSAPLYLMDGEHRIMISDAINESDRLSSCNKRVRKKLASEAGAFQVYTFQIAGGENFETGGTDEITINYNVSGICLSEAAFHKLQQEISLAAWTTNFKGLWFDPDRQFFIGTVPLANGTFRSIAIRRNRVPQVDVRDFSILNWTDRYYYEVCANPKVYAALEKAFKASR